MALNPGIIADVTNCGSGRVDGLSKLLIFTVSLLQLAKNLDFRTRPLPW